MLTNPACKRFRFTYASRFYSLHHYIRKYVPMDASVRCRPNPSTLFPSGKEGGVDGYISATSSAPMRLQGVYESYPDDPDACAFYGLSLMAMTTNTGKYLSAAVLGCLSTLYLPIITWQVLDNACAGCLCPS